MDLGMGEIVVILLIVLLLFGPTKVPQLGESLGKTIRSFRDAMRSDSSPARPSRPAERPPAAAAEQPPATPRPDAQAPAASALHVRSEAESAAPGGAGTNREQ